MSSATLDTPDEKTDERDPGWRRVGQSIKDDRNRRGMERNHLAVLVTSKGGTMSGRMLALIEQGRIGHKGGASIDATLMVCHALDWPRDHVARLRAGEAELPPLPDQRMPRKVSNPAAKLTGRLQVTRSDQLARLEHALSELVESTRAELIRLGVGLAALDGDIFTHHATASRTARQMVTTWVANTIADVEDNDYTAPPIT
jgi:hypothetical protein